MYLISVPVLTQSPPLTDTCGVGCSEIQYPNTPWNSGEGTLTAQPVCYFNLGNGTAIPTNALRVTLEIDDAYNEISVRNVGPASIYR